MYMMLFLLLLLLCILKFCFFVFFFGWDWVWVCVLERNEGAMELEEGFKKGGDGEAINRGQMGLINESSHVTQRSSLAGFLSLFLLLLMVMNITERATPTSPKL